MDALSGGANAFGRRTLLGASLFGAAQACASPAGAQPAASINERMSGDIAPVHDPCILRQGDFHYVFCTTGSSEREPGGFVACRRSRDLVAWERIGFVFPAIPAWAREAVPGTRGIWAPDIALLNGRYHLYYSVSTFGSNHSAIGLATNATLDPAAPDYAWRDEGLVLQSRRHDRFNAIDPNLVADRDGKYWLSWGSFWTGLKITRIDPATGKRHAQDDEIHSLAWRPVAPGAPSAIEAPFIFARGEFYYLFASFDFCCRGANSTYFVACGRSRNVLGPYVDHEGKPMMRGGGAVVIEANARFKGPGHNAVLSDGGRDYLVYQPTTHRPMGRRRCASRRSTGRRTAGRGRNYETGITYKAGG
jgi:arabinan endo-1,5-alpha-L-arabinosidase